MLIDRRDLIEILSDSVLGSDAEGRFLPYLFTDENNKIVIEPVVGYDVPGDGDWYLVPKTTQEAVITEPYFYPINGVDVLMITISYPVTVNNRFLGVVTADLLWIPYRHR